MQKKPYIHFMKRGGIVFLLGFFIQCGGEDMMENPSEKELPTIELRGPISQLGGLFAPTSVKIADIDGDGKSDIVITNQYSEKYPSEAKEIYSNIQEPRQSIVVYYGKGGNSFSGPAYVPTGLWPKNLLIDDFNGDGKPDLVMTTALAAANILINQGGRNFTPGMSFIPTNAFGGTDAVPPNLAAADLDGDGSKDLVVTSPSMLSGTFGLIWGASSGGFGMPSFWPTMTGAKGVVLADLNKDGKQDLLFSRFTNDLIVQINRGNKTFEESTYGKDYGVGLDPYAVATGDFNKDGWVDVALTNFDSGNVSILINSQKDVRARHFNIGELLFPTDDKISDKKLINPREVEVVDLDNDGNLDLLVVNQGAENLSFLKGYGSGAFEKPRLFPVGASPRGLAVGDLDQDGKPDVVVSNYKGNSVTVLMNSTLTK